MEAVSYDELLHILIINVNVCKHLCSQLFEFCQTQEDTQGNVM